MAKFRVRARTVDLLGRQQIANISTAISELFKNAHDAYARNVQVDYFRDDGLFVLRDDGLGMTREDFEHRWLTLGTDSKVGAASGLSRPPVDQGQELRPILGEKGIGRLAIAVIGRQVLVLTRARRGDVPQDTITAAYIHWGLFELPGVDLDDVIIPIAEFPAARMPNGDDIKTLVTESWQGLEALGSRVETTAVMRIYDDMSRFLVDPGEISNYLLDVPFSGDHCGTQFYILPADEIIKDDIDTREAENKATRFERNLIGFTNTMTPDHRQPPVLTRFYDHRDEGEPIELIGNKAFFTPEEFKEVDHHIIGRFDEFGQFEGKIGVYHMEPEPYVLSWDKTGGGKTLCGPFSLSLAVFQAAQRDSLLEPEEWARVSRKGERHGGVYVYKDGVRVQPYGDSDHDFLDIERRRTLSAGYYYYSYRRMFGAVELTSEHNGALTEKAGREGFREDTAFRQFRSILMNFFVQSAADFFREEGKYSDVWEERRSELQKNAKIRQQHEKRVRDRKSHFQSSLNGFFDAVEQQKPHRQLEEVAESFERRVNHIAENSRPASEKAEALLRVEHDARETFRKIENDYTLTKPRVGLSKAVNNEWVAYQVEAEKLVKEYFRPAELRVMQAVSEVATHQNLELDALTRIRSTVEDLAKESRLNSKRLSRETEAVGRDLALKVRETARDSLRAVNHLLDEVRADLERMSASGLELADLETAKSEYEDRIRSVAGEERARLTKLREQLDAVFQYWEADGVDTLDLTEALEEEIEDLRERQEADLELAQIGLALSTINHEFEKSVAGIRDGLRRLGGWAQENPNLQQLYQDIRSSFDHLDGYLTMFTPLDRRLHRRAVDISGKETYDFLQGLFRERLDRNDIKFEATEEFISSSVHGYPSSFYPVFVNLVDNAIFWLNRVRDAERRIILDADEEDLLVRDNGPGVSVRDRDNIFALRFSRKPGGRGMGLHISRQTLEKIGYELTLDEPRGERGATFRISPAVELE